MTYGALVLGLFTVLSPTALAQDEQADLRAKLEKKLAKDFVDSGGWVLDHDEARTRAAKEKKLLFVYFTRTYAP